MRLFISGILLLAAQWANASCNINAIVQHVWPDASLTAEGAITTDGLVIKTNGASPQSAICRVWPANPQLTLAAVPLMSQQQSDYDHTGSLQLLVLDSTTLEVKQRLHLANRMDDDAVRISSIAFDTARWKVAPNQTAFGLRIGRTGSSRVNPFSENVLSLYVIENHQLRTILEEVLVAESSGEWDGVCAGEFTDTERSLAMDSASHHGYAAIRVNERSVSSTAWIDASGECVTKDQPGKATWLLRYDGKQYRIPEKLQPLL
ncbi:hypothetical protein [Entomohabitans teleogrylli]|uniref:hypothetical protein n=1 Tax=Entomohabitans teleogrylli TaxID=1384589 RepID=UPI00073D4AE1|nr:hypothetical protein [Entomohabitans teleogrylli]